MKIGYKKPNLYKPCLKKKEVWDIVENPRPKPAIAKQIKKKDKNNTIIIKIIQ